LYTQAQAFSIKFILNLFVFSKSITVLCTQKSVANHTVSISSTEKSSRVAINFFHPTVSIPGTAL
jgi:hypothetical protein